MSHAVRIPVGGVRFSGLLQGSVVNCLQQPPKARSHLDSWTLPDRLHNQHFAGGARFLLEFRRQAENGSGPRPGESTAHRRRSRSR